MNPKSIFFACTALLPLLAASAMAQGTAFNYQGHLSDGTSAATGIYDMRFGIYDARTNGDQAAGPITHDAVEVHNGLFNVTLDFGPDVFTGSNRWLEISVRTNGDSIFTTLTPRQPLLPTPYAITAANLSGTLGATQLNGVLPSSTLAGDYSAILNFNNESNHYAGDGTALRFGGFGYCVLPCYWNLNGNAGTSPALNFIGTTDNTALEFRVNGQRALRLEPTTNSPNLIGGFQGNYVDGGGVGNVIAGGGTGDAPNRASPLGSDDPDAVPLFSTVVGGAGNTIARSHYGSIVGGSFNSILRDSSARSAVEYDSISGGLQNSVREGGASTITGGSSNLIVGDTSNRVRNSVIGGGNANSMWSDGLESISASTIAGGQGNRIQRASWATIGGGRGHFVGVFSDQATIAGGFSNQISSRAINGTVVGGANNIVDRLAVAATVSGGQSNVASGPYSTVAGGLMNVASEKAFAAGTRAKAIHSGSFVWADAEDEDFASTGTNQFLIRASGGVGIGTTNPQAALHVAGDLIVEGSARFGSYFIGTNSSATGIGAIALGDRAQASGDYSTALGANTEATGARSTAIGFGAVAGNDGAAALGFYANSMGYLSVALGNSTRASNYSSTAMGLRTVAMGAASTAMGRDTVASGGGSTAVGSQTLASADSSIASGYKSVASGDFSTAMGSNSVASGIAAVAMGSSTSATNDYTFAAGLGTVANGYGATALGFGGEASGEFSTKMGLNSQTSGRATIASGYGARAMGNISTAFGFYTTASGDTSTVLGFESTASGPSSTAMGSRTLASGLASTAMGTLTTASGAYATAMGVLSTASGAASVAMGDTCAATNSNTFAAGHLTRAEDPGSFVWAAGNTNVFPSSTSNRVHFYAAGGVAVEYAGQDQYGRGNKWLVLASQEPGKVINVYNGAYLSEGGAWTDTSDRNAKENFEPVDPKEVLERVTNLPLTSWSYRSESNSVRHLGPVAQDFHAAFGLGADDKHIAGLDSSGVALAAIQGLSQELKAKQAEIDQLKQRLEALETRFGAFSR
jgi:hypothetical protein